MEKVIKEMKLAYKLITLFFFLSLFTGCSVNKYKKITLIGTSDLQGSMNPFKTKIDLDKDGKKEPHIVGGIDKIAFLIKQEKKRNRNTLVISTGDDLMGRYFNHFKGKAIYTLMNKAGYKYYAFGNHEFDKGSETLADALNYANFTAFCTDLDVSKTKLKGKCVKYQIKSINGIKVGIFSLMTEDFPEITPDKKVKLIGKNIETAKKYISLLKSKGADIIIALTHIGTEEDIKLAKNTKGIDIIFGGHSHNYISKKLIVNNTLIVNGGEKGIFLVKILLYVKPNKKIDLEKTEYQLIPVYEKMKSDKETKKLLEQFNSKLPKATIIGKTLKDWDFRSSKIRFEEAESYNMITDLLRKAFNVDIVLINSGAFRGNKIYPAGNITDRTIDEIDTFRNELVILTIKGKYIKEILEHSASKIGTGGFLQVSGIRFKINLNKQPQKIKNEHLIQKGERVSDIQILINGKWENLEQNKEYEILTNAFLYYYKGDGYYWFKKYGKNPKNTYTTIYSFLINYFHKHKELTPKEPDNRIKIIGK